MTVKDYATMYENGITLEAIHKMHRDTQTCSLCELNPMPTDSYGG